MIVAENQNAGRGRFGRTWVSTMGNLYLSVIFRPTPAALTQLNAVAGVAVARAIRKTTGLSPRIKWPNDVLVSGKKTAGILVETVAEGSEVCYSVVGIGVNITMDDAQAAALDGQATGLEQAAVRPVARPAVFRQLLTDLDSLYLQATAGKSPQPEWVGLLDTLGKRVRVTWRDETWVGQAEQVDEIGNLLLRLDNGNLVTMTAGDVTLHGPGA